MWTHCEFDFFFDLRQQHFYWTFCISVDQLVRIRKFLNLNFDSVFLFDSRKEKILFEIYGNIFNVISICNRVSNYCNKNFEQQ